MGCNEEHYLHMVPKAASRVEGLFENPIEPYLEHTLSIFEPYINHI
jgi:hypothetical protein